MQFTSQIITLNNDWGESPNDGKLISRARRSERKRGNKIRLWQGGAGRGTQPVAFNRHQVMRCSDFKGIAVAFLSKFSQVSECVQTV